MRILRECGPIPGVFRLFETGTEGAVDVRAFLDRQNAGICLEHLRGDLDTHKQAGDDRLTI